MADESFAAPPSGDALGEAARQIDAAYPGLYAHQRAGIAFLFSRRRAILADDMGLGKTRQAIIAAREAAPAGPFLVICPAAVKLNWRREIAMIEADADVQIVEGKAVWEDGRRWTVVNYDLLGRSEERLRAVAWGGIIVDEAHAIKNDGRRSKHVLELLGVGTGRTHGTQTQATDDPEAIYLLTGTPMASRPRDLFNLLKAVRHPLAASFFSYAKRYCAAFDNGFGLDTNGASNLEELAQVISGVLLRRTKDEALDLPPKVRSWEPIQIAAKGVGGLEARALDFLTKHPARSGPTWTTFLGLLNRARHATAVAKVPATLSAVRERLEADEKVVVFSSYTAVVEAVAAEFGAQAVTISGSDSASARQAAVDALQTDPSVRVLVGNLLAAGVGINLTAATHVVFNDLDWVPGNHWQAEDRIYRIGQTRPAFVTYLLAEGTLDDFVAALLEAKARAIGVLEDEAAHHASLIEAVVTAAVGGERPSSVPSEPARPRPAAKGPPRSGGRSSHLGRLPSDRRPSRLSAATTSVRR